MLEHLNTLEIKSIFLKGWNVNSILEIFIPKSSANICIRPMLWKTKMNGQRVKLSRYTSNCGHTDLNTHMYMHTYIQSFTKNHPC